MVIFGSVPILSERLAILGSLWFYFLQISGKSILRQDRIVTYAQASITNSEYPVLLCLAETAR